MQQTTSSSSATTRHHAALAAERERLSRRIKLIHGHQYSKDLQKYRTMINKFDAAESRGVGYHYYPGPRGYLREAEDTVQLLHTWLDDRGIDPQLIV